MVLQLGKASVNPPDLCLKWHAWLPAKLKSPLQAQVWGVHAGLTQLYMYSEENQVNETH